MFCIFFVFLALDSIGGNAAAADCGPDVPVFTVSESGIPEYPQRMTVFGIPLFAGAQWTLREMNHVAFVLAKYLDQDEDGCPDDPKLMETLLQKNDYGKSKPLMLLEDQYEAGSAFNAIAKFGYFEFGATPRNQIKMECSGLNFQVTDHSECQDSTLEEVFHFVTHWGFSLAYPDIWGHGWEDHSKLTDAMDLARGGRFEEVPAEYPAGAWWTYQEPDCNYHCQATEYLFWSYCSYSGICAARKNNPDEHSMYEPVLKSELVEKDLPMVDLLENQNGYVFPLLPPTGTYMGMTVDAEQPEGTEAPEEPAAEEDPQFCAMVQSKVLELMVETGITSLEQVQAMKLKKRQRLFKGIKKDLAKDGIDIPSEWTMEDLGNYLVMKCPGLLARRK